MRDESFHPTSPDSSIGSLKLDVVAAEKDDEYNSDREALGSLPRTCLSDDAIHILSNTTESGACAPVGGTILIDKMPSDTDDLEAVISGGSKTRDPERQALLQSLPHNAKQHPTAQKTLSSPSISVPLDKVSFSSDAGDMLSSSAEDTFFLRDGKKSEDEVLRKKKKKRKAHTSKYSTLALEDNDDIIYQFTDYAPKVFKRLRLLDGISSYAYCDSLEPLVLMPSTHIRTCISIYLYIYIYKQA